MHILLIHQAFVSPKQAGGTRHFEFAQRCLKRGHKFTIVASNISYIDGKRNTAGNRLVTHEEAEGVGVSRAFTYAALHKSFIWRVVSFLSFMITSIVAGLRAKDVDLVMGTSPPIFQAVSAWLLAKLKGKPFLLEIRDLWPEFAIDMGVLKNPSLIWLSRKLESFLYQKANHLIVNSPAYKNYLIDKGIPPEKISLVPNGVDPNMFKPNEKGNGFRKRYQLDGKFVATYAGALGMANDIQTILGAADCLKNNSDIHFLLVGDGKERQHLESRAKVMELNNVTFTGAQPKNSMANILASSDACLATLMNIPMFKTTYPNKVFDYMAAGRPTVLAIDGVIRDVIEAAQGGIFVPPNNPEELAEAVAMLHDDPDRAKEMGQSARHHVATFFNRNVQAKQFIDLVESLY
ncbi:glycosyl transferase, family I [Desulfosarcina variabilis str. Montpellier]|uniref:glycosyltransferase family 4 protein n=1 Tax=Desulfosarcina variabilis TaxID=2300 RepID=UPI003AFB64A8